MEIPTHLTHKPIIGVDYSKQDANAGDAAFLSIGKSTWNAEDISAKIFRISDNSGRWSRQSEEIPLWRVLDLAKLIVASITGKHSSLNEEVVSSEDMTFLNSFLQENMELFAPRLQELRELLEYTQPETKNSTRPNIFSFATSELSQDAIIAWLIGWADDSYLSSYYDLCILGKAFVSLFSDIPASDIHSINAVDRQWNNIDIWAKINGDTFLTIEDKTDTSIHDNQLNRYKKLVENEYSPKGYHLCFSYVKTGNEPLSIEQEVIKSGYKVINRQDVLTVLNSYSGTNSLVTDYRNHLQSIEDETNKFKTISVDNWNWRNWQGFYKELEKHIEVESWNYVDNRNGGFWGLWWHFKENQSDGIQMYLQFEESKLCIKIMNDSDIDNSEVRNKYYSNLVEKAKSLGVNVVRPQRFGAGTYMTIGIIPKEEIFGDGNFNLNLIVPKLKQLEQLVDRCIK